MKVDGFGIEDMHHLIPRTKGIGMQASIDFMRKKTDDNFV